MGQNQNHSYEFTLALSGAELERIVQTVYLSTLGSRGLSYEIDFPVPDLDGWTGGHLYGRLGLPAVEIVLDRDDPDMDRRLRNFQAVVLDLPLEETSYISRDPDQSMLYLHGIESSPC